MNAKVLLINPETPDFVDNKEYYIPTSMLYLASILKENDIDVKILDLNITKYKKNETTKSEILKALDEFTPTVVGIGCLFSGSFPIASDHASFIKGVYKDIKIVIGGMHATLFNKEIIENCDFIDYVVSGEGEISLLKLVQYFLGKLAIESVPGLTYKRDGKVITNKNLEIIEDLNLLPKLNYSLIDISEYYHSETELWHNPRNLSIKASVPILASRGCPMHCNFCAMYQVMGRSWRCRPYTDVVDEIEMLYTVYNHMHFSFMDDNLTVNKKNIISLCNEIIKRGMNIQFETPNGLHINTLDRDVLTALYEAGMVRTCLAIESGNEYIRNKIMHKNLKTEKIYKVVEFAKTFKDLYIAAFFLIGMPEETEESLQDTYDMINNLGIHRYYINNVIPFPGTDLFTQCLQDNLFTKKIDLNNIWKTVYGWHEYKHDASIKQFHIQPYNMTLERLLYFREKMNERAAQY